MLEARESLRVFTIYSLDNHGWGTLSKKRQGFGMAQAKASEGQPVVLKYQTNKQQQKGYSMPECPGSRPRHQVLGVFFPSGC